MGDELHIVLEETECINVSILAEFVVPGPCEQEDKSKCLTMKRVCCGDFELIVEYTRQRINSRNPKDLEWKLHQCALHLKKTPKIIHQVVQYMQAVHNLGSLKAVREEAKVALDTAKAEEQRLMLAMLDAKYAVAERHKELQEAERIYEEEQGRMVTFATIAKELA
jgi:hypothetical protein